MKPWETQKVLLKSDLPDRQATVKKILSIDNKRVCFLASFLYLTACRIGEMLPKSDGLPLVEKEDIKGKPCLKFILRNEKNRTVSQKILPVPIEEYPEMSELILSWFGVFKANPLSRRRIQQLLGKELGWNAHFLRHIRLTHLTIEKKYTDQQLRLWAGWTDSRPATTYIKYRYSDFIAT